MLYKAKPAYLDGKTKVYMGLRAEDISLLPEDIKNSKAVVKVKVSHKEELGSETLVYGDINMGGDGYVESSTRVIIKDNSGRDLKAGDIVDVAWNIEKIHLLTMKTNNVFYPVFRSTII